MTTFRILLAACWCLLGVMTWAQTTPPPSVPGSSTSGPAASASGVTEWTWAYGELREIGIVDARSNVGTPWKSTLPQLLVKGWDDLPDHVVSQAEKDLWLSQKKAGALLDLQKQRDQKALSRSKMLLSPTLPSGEPAASDKALADLDAKIADAEADKNPPAGLPDTLPLKLKSSTGKEGLPSPYSTVEMLEKDTGARYLVTGTLKILAGYLSVTLDLSSGLEDRVLAHWSGTFAPEEAPEQMQLARRAFLAALLGRPWAGVELSSEVDGTLVQIPGSGWKTLPWTSDFLQPGTLEMDIRRPGLPPAKQSVELEDGKVAVVKLEAPADTAQTLSIDTDPEGAALWLDSRWLGTSPLVIPRPLSLSRLKMKLDGYETSVLELGPQSPAQIDWTLGLPKTPPDADAARDRFYLAVTAFSFSLTGTILTKDFSDQQLRLVAAYAAGGNVNTYNEASERFRWLWYGSQAGAVLTTGVFVWMMFTLGDYLTAAQTPLP